MGAVVEMVGVGVDVGVGTRGVGIGLVGSGVGATVGDDEEAHEARRRKHKSSMIQMTLARYVTIEVSF